MSSYRRIVSYLYKYTDGKKAENTGHVRAEVREDGLRLQFHLKDLKMMDERRIKIYFYFHEDEKLRTVFVDEFLCQRGNCEYKKVFSEKRLSEGLEDMAGVIFCDDGGLLYGSCWDDKEIREEKIEYEKAKGLEEERKEKKMTQEEAVPLKTSEVSNRNPMQEFLDSLEKIHLKDNPRFIEAGKIDVKDIAKLSFKDWKLAENSFLQQGYESFGHLLFGKIELLPGQIIWILGVPGNYENREKYLANIFGFFDYIPEENGLFRTGGKGYWITRLTEF